MRKGDRPVSKHIVAFLEQHKGIGYRIADLIKEMSEQGWRHGDNAVVLFVLLLHGDNQ